MKPEDTARVKIDRMLTESGWIIQDYNDLNLGAGFGVAVREYPLGSDAVDYALFVEKSPVGVVEAKKVGWTLSGVAEQSGRYLDGLHKKISGPRSPPFSYETTGIETLFADRRDPKYRSRHVFTFHRPESLDKFLREDTTLRGRLRQIPALDKKRLRSCQIDAINNLERSFSNSHQRALIHMATGSGKTFTAVTLIYRLIKFAKAKRILFLVDRANLGKQAMSEFQKYVTPDDGRKFTDLYNIQHLQSQVIGGDSVVISTIQRLYSILQGKKEFDAEDEDFSSFEGTDSDAQIDVQYNPSIPISKFDFIIIDECHRSIYNKWKQVLDYFDSFLIGLTATPSKHTVGFFNNNQVMEYPHERAVADRVNVSYWVYRIKTRVSSAGGKIEAGEIIEVRNKGTREKRLEELDNDYVYEKWQLDRDVVVPDQIRKVIKTFKEKQPEIFPGRKNIPKTLIFAKDDAHAEEITKITREVFGEGNEFCQKITYKTTGDKPENIIKNFRNLFNPRIAVSVDMIATGTDIKPLECIIFMRDVQSKIYFDQMKGRGTRTIDPDTLMTVTPDAKSKDHFVIVDAVGVCEHAMSDTHSMNRKKGVSLKSLMQEAAEYRADEDSLESLANKLSRLNNTLDDKGKEAIEKTSGMNLSQMMHKLLDGINRDKQIEFAKEKFKTQNPTEKQLAEASNESLRNACSIFDSSKLRQTILDEKRRNEIIIDTITVDEVESAEFTKQAKEISTRTVDHFKEFLNKNKDELAALSIIYSKPYNIRDMTFNDIKDLADAIERPPYNLTPEKIWDAYKRLDKSAVRDNPAKMLTNLISIVRFSSGLDKTLVPFSDVVDSKFVKWMETQGSSGKTFTPEQKQWLYMIKNHIASSITITLDDLDGVPFNQKGGRVKMYQLFGDSHEKILNELHKILISE